jgi:hypothetical protein
MPTKNAKGPKVVVAKAKGFPGKGSKDDVITFDPTAELPATAGPQGSSVPRPPRPRYPITREAFVTLKTQARKLKLKPKFSNLVRDKAVEGAPPSAAPGALAPGLQNNFHGISMSGFPPDSTMAVGANHVLLAVNFNVFIYNKGGGAPVQQKTLNQWFGNLATGTFVFDPKVLFDQSSQRWILIAVALPDPPGPIGSWLMLSVSQSANPLGGWWSYKLDATLDGSTPTSNWADYPSLGTDPFNIYVTLNMFKFTGNQPPFQANGPFAYAKVRVINKLSVITGAPALWVDFPKLKNADGSFAFTVQPCHTFGAPGTESLVNSYYPSTAASTKNKLSLWSINPLWLPFPTMNPLITVTVDAYGLPPNGAQKGGGVPIDTGDIRVYNAVSRAGSIWCALTSRYNWGAATNVASIHWFQINATSGAIVQQGLFGFQNRSYFYPAIMPDTNGNVFLCCARCSPTEFASAWFTGRKANDSPGLMQNAALLKAGVANYVKLDTAGDNRWGDYTGIASDPSDALVVWFFNEYAVAGNNWDTWVGKAKF